MPTISREYEYYSPLFPMGEIPEESENREEEDDFTSRNPSKRSIHRAKSGEGDSLLQAYLSEIQRYRVLSKEKQMELALRFQEKGDEEAACKLITSNLRLTVKIAKNYKSFWRGNFLDLIQEGNLGLMHAIRKFDPRRDIKFSYYASYWIRAYIIKFIANNRKLVKIITTQSQRKLFYRLTKERDKLIAQGSVPEPGVLAERLHVSEGEVADMVERLAGRELSLDTPVADDSRESFASLLADTGMLADEQVSRNQERRLLMNEIQAFRRTLSGKEADILDNRIMAERGATLQTLGDKYQLSRERIRQIEKTVLRKFKRWLKINISEFDEFCSDLLSS